MSENKDALAVAREAAIDALTPKCFGHGDMPRQIATEYVDTVLPILSLLPVDREAVIPDGYVLVPVDTGSSFVDSTLPPAMIEAGEVALERAQYDLANYIPGKTIDWDSGMMVIAIYCAMLAACPSQQGEG